MGNSLGLSIGATNLVAVCAGGRPLIRRAVLRLSRGGTPEVGLPSGSPHLDESGLLLTGFVDRVGDPVPLVAADGSAHDAGRLLAEALDAMMHATDAAWSSSIAIAVPAHWGAREVGALRAAVRARPDLSPDGVTPQLISDASAALAALRSDPGLPERGVVALLDFGAGGTGITLANAGSNSALIGPSVRHVSFAGDQIDQSVLIHVLADISGARDVDPSSTAAVGSLARLRDQCRLAKERLSADTVAVLNAEVPGYRADIRLTRTELESLIEEPLDGAVDALEEALAANDIPRSALTAVATVGGGASIPLITERLSERMRVPVVTTPHPLVKAATGAQAIAAQGVPLDVATSMVAAVDTPTGLSTAAWPVDSAEDVAGDPPPVQAAAAGSSALAWSEEDSAEEPVAYLSRYDSYRARPGVNTLPARLGVLPWYRRPVPMLAAAAVLALTPAGALAYTLVTRASESGPTTPGAVSEADTGAPAATPSPAPPGSAVTVVDQTRNHPSPPP